MHRLVIVLFTMAMFSGGAYATELKELYAAYQQALESGGRSEILDSAKKVYVYTRDNHPETSKSRAASALNYGEALLLDWQYSAAHDVLVDAVGFFEDIYGEEALELVDPLILYAQAYAGAYKYRDSRGSRGYRKIVKRAQKLVKTHRGKESYLYGKVTLEAARIGVDIAEDFRATRIAKEAYRIFTEVHSDQVFDRYLATFYMGKHLMAIDSNKKAEPYILEALDIATSDQEKSNRFELTARAFLVELYEKIGDQARSTEQCQLIGKKSPFDMDGEPKPIFKPVLKYPESMLRVGKSARVVANFTVDANGFATDIKFRDEPETSPFAQEARTYLEKSRYAPRFEDGVAVDTPDRKMTFGFSIAE
uniref:energy transducer TonB n=1 Tax=Microbulbifer agarilyticus TaxID=260552 RepID=UPI0002559F94|nr:energy transducer TonB [Microbulbifer agarilyticus]